MTEAMTYSLRTMKDCNGNALSDGAYLQWFISESARRLLKSASTLRELVNGTVAFTFRTPAEALALLADVRRHGHILQECAAHFSAKRVIAEQFTTKLNELQPEIDGAESAYETLRAWFN